MKTQSGGGQQYVEVFDQKLVAPSGTAANQGIASPAPPRQQLVVVGLSNDTDTEIMSGLKEGDQIVVRTIAATQTIAASAPSLFGTGGNNRGIGGGTRTPTTGGR